MHSLPIVTLKITKKYRRLRKWICTKLRGEWGVRKLFSILSWGTKISNLTFIGTTFFWHLKISLRPGTRHKKWLVPKLSANSERIQKQWCTFDVDYCFDLRAMDDGRKCCIHIYSLFFNIFPRYLLLHKKSKIVYIYDLQNMKLLSYDSWVIKQVCPLHTNYTFTINEIVINLVNDRCSYR